MDNVATCMIAMRRLTKVLVTDLPGNERTAYVARPSTTGARHFVAIISKLDKFLATTWFGACSNLGIRNGFLDLETTLSLVLLFHFRTFQRYVGGLAAQFTSFLAARLLPGSGRSFGPEESLLEYRTWDKS